MRYADDFVVLARYQSRRLIDWVESQLEGRFRLTINRKKTRVVNLNQTGSEPGLPGLHVPVRPRPAWPRPSLPERVPVEEIAGPAAGPRARTDRPQPVLDADRRTDRRAQSAAARLEAILPSRLSSRWRFVQVNWFVSRTSGRPLASSESTSLPTAGRRIVLRPPASPRPATVVNDRGRLLVHALRLKVFG